MAVLFEKLGVSNFSQYGTFSLVYEIRNIHNGGIKLIHKGLILYTGSYSESYVFVGPMFICYCLSTRP